MALAIVFGGSGFIGAHLLKRLVRGSEFDQIMSLDIEEPKQRLENVTYAIQDIRQQIEIKIDVANAVIFSLAALRNYPGHSDAEYTETNLVGAQNVIRFAERISASKIVFTSTMSLYPVGEDEKIEATPPQPINIYGQTKLAAEQDHLAWADRNSNVQLVISRPAVIFGQHDDGNFTRLADALKKGYFVYPGRRDTIKANGHVTDLVESFFFALRHPDRQIVYNFAYPTAATIKDIVTSMSEIGNYRRAPLRIPLKLMLLAALPFEFLNLIGLKNSINRKRILKLVDSTHIVPKWLIDQGFEWSSDLHGGLAQWYDDKPAKEFI